MEYCVSRGGKLVATAVTFIDLAFDYPVKLSRLFAYWTSNHLGKSMLSKPFKTSIIIGELFVKFFDGILSGFHVLFSNLTLYLNYSGDMT